MSKSDSKQMQLTVVAPDHGKLVEELHSLSFELGVAGAKADCIWLLPTTVGLSHRVAQGAKSVDGLTVGISPADSAVSHTDKYRLPQANYDSIIYSGLPLAARDQTLIRSADAVIFVGDRASSPQLYALAIELECTIGVLLETESQLWYESFNDTLKEQLGTAPHPIFEHEPKKLVARLRKQLEP
jgi:hypothetical protein